MTLPFSFTRGTVTPDLDDLIEVAARINSIAAHLEKQHERMQLADLLVYYKQLDDAYEMLDTARKRVYHILDHLDKNAVPEALDKNDCTDGIRIQFSNEVGYNFRRSTKYSAKTKDKEGLFSWVRERGDGALITETINAGTLATYLKNKMLEEGVEPPSDLVELTTYYGVGVNKYTPK